MKDLLKTSRTKFLNTWLQYQKMCILINEKGETVNKYNNKYHRTIDVNVNPVDVNLTLYIDFDKENNKEGPRFKVDDHVILSKYKNIFAKGYLSNWS